MNEKNYYLGLDMGTSSVGWAVTDENYTILRKKGKDMWGIREFERADTAEKRRSYRISRRRRQRQTVREGMLRDFFADAILAIDENFFIRLDNSKYFLDDKDEKLMSNNGIFDDKDYKDKDYYQDYPTIFHLRKALLDVDDTGKEFDVRLVYLALLNMFKHRGHFLLSSSGDGLDVAQIDVLYQELIKEINEDYEMALDCKPIEEVVSIIGNKEMGRKLKHEKVLELFGCPKRNKKANEFLKCICGLSANANVIFDMEADEKITICFHDFSYTDKIPEIMEQLGDSRYAIVEGMKAIYDYAILSGTLKGYDYLSLARVDSYEKHAEDLKLLKKLYRKYKTKEEYDLMFRSNENGTYSAYVNSLNSDDSLAEDRKYRRNMKGRKADDLFASVKKALRDYMYDDEVQYVFDQIEKEQFLPKQLTGENGVIPNQVHRKEMVKILENAEKYLPFLKEKDEGGRTVSQRILCLFSFQIPYYVGPLGEKSKKFGWAVRKEDGKVLPWNINDKIDMEATSKNFIENLIRTCTYLSDEKVMPKASLKYEKYCVLNEINTICIDGERIDTEIKKNLFKECFGSGKKVTRKQICNYLVACGLIKSEEQVTGIDINVKSSLSSYGKMYAIFGDRLQEDKYRNIAEDIIYWGTIFADSKEMFRKHLTEYVEQGVLTESNVKRILGYKFKDWGRFSKELLDLQGCDKSTGEMISIIQALWDNSHNFMELINSDDFTFKEALAEKKVKAIKTLADFQHDDLDEYYFSAPVKRMIWQTVLVVREIEKIMGRAPKRVFVEMTRTEEEKGDNGRKASRANQLLEAYKNIENTEIHNWKEEISVADSNGKLRSKKLYLYYMQMGRDMYTGKEIDLERLFDDNLYDIDHIYPRHYVKDDSILNNLVLVNKSANEHLKKDLYPVPEQISSNPDVRELWNTLHKNKLISDEKYKRLVSRNGFTEKQMGDFIARQLVETSQGTKGITELLGALFPEETEIVYAKASNVSEFRAKNGFYKSRLVNEFHHAQDAYLNIIVGNAYYTKFTKNPWNFIRNEYARDKKENHYNLDKMFEWDIKRGGQTAWVAKRNGENGTIDIVRKMMSKNSPLMTRMSFEQHGGIANETLYSAKKAIPENYFPLKTTDERMKDVTRYGGYTSATIAYYFVVKYCKKGQEIISIEGLPIYCKNVVERSENGLEQYCSEQLGYENVRILCRKLKIQSLIEINGYRMYLSGKTGDRLSMRNAENLCLSEKTVTYIKRIEKMVETSVQDRALCESENIHLYDTLLDKHLHSVFSKRPNPFGEKLKLRREKFITLSLTQQCKALYQILQLTQIGITKADLTLIGESANSGLMLISKNVKEPKNFYRISQSATGLHEKKMKLASL